jgi:hypothetical protein
MPRNLFSFAIPILLFTIPTLASPVTYTIDPTQSSLLATGFLSNNVPTFQNFGSNNTTYSGTIFADRTTGTIQFISGSFIDATQQPSKQRPDIDGFDGRNFADYGLTAPNFLFSQTYAAFRDIFLDLNSDPLTVAANGNFDSTLDIIYASGNVDWNTGFQWNNVDFSGRTLFNAPSNTPSVIVANGIETLTLPLRFSTTFGTVTSGDSTFRLSGALVATRSLNNNPPQWIHDGDGTWSDPANWDGGIPDAPDAIANFLGAITSPRTITLDGHRTVGSITFNNPQSYTIAHGVGGSLTLGQNGGVASLTTDSGAHFINAKVIFAATTSIDLAAGSSLGLGNGIEISTSQTVIKSGPGLLSIDGPQSHQGGANLFITEGPVVLNSNAGAPATSITPATANLSIIIGNENSTTTLNSSQDLATLTISFDDTGAQGLDLASTATEFHSLSIHSGDLDSAKSSLTAAIAHAKITPGDGLFDSGLSGGLHPNSAIGLATLTDAHGDPYLFIRPTKIGDLNLDGQVTISDFIDLASHFNGPGSWQDGDLNADGQITISDFIDLASNFNSTYSGQTLPLSPSDLAALNAFASSHGLTPIPEPSTLTLLFLATITTFHFGKRWQGNRMWPSYPLSSLLRERVGVRVFFDGECCCSPVIGGKRPHAIALQTPTPPRILICKSFPTGLP